MPAFFVYIEFVQMALGFGRWNNLANSMSGTYRFASFEPGVLLRCYFSEEENKVIRSAIVGLSVTQMLDGWSDSIYPF